VADPPKRVWRDWAVVGLLLASAVLEGVFRTNLEWRPFSLIFGAALLVPLFWRRTQPLAMLLITFGSITLVEVIALLNTDEAVGLYTTVSILLLPYALFRWASGRHVVIGFGLMLVMFGIGSIRDYSGVGETIGAMVVFLFPAVLVALVRYATTARLRQTDQIKALERERLARELHDTVAHHVSAIIIRAQAGRVVGQTDSAAALDALEVIEEEAARTLSEMRLMVGTLRGDEEAAFRPQPMLADIQTLANTITGPGQVQVQLLGDLGNLPPSVETTVYRLVQESLTNAVRHAKNWRLITIQVTGNSSGVSMVVSDDGEPSSIAHGVSGYGLVGMEERSALVRGTLTYGANSGPGWFVRAELPREPRAVATAGAGQASQQLRSL
jgi:signal transduction histidine kinase